MSSPQRQGSIRQEETAATIVDDDKLMSNNPCLPMLPRSPARSSSGAGGQIATPSSPMTFDFSNVINSQDLLEIAACPCCKQCIDDRQQQTLNGGPRMITDPYSTVVEKGGSMDSDDEDTLPRGVAEGLNYHPRKILVEGWLHKKGTGKDWLGSKSWKPRWARLVMARLEGFEVDVPLLMIYWYAGTSSPSNVIILDSTVVFPIDMEDKLRWDAFRFDIRNARTVATNTTVNRTFCAPKKARDAWIYAISQALLMYEKAHDKARKAALQANNEARRVSPQQHSSYCRPLTPPYEEVWSGGDRFVSPSSGSNNSKGSSPLPPPISSKRLSSPPRMPSPPTSPRSRNNSCRPPQPTTAKRAIPRPDTPCLPKPAVEKC